MPKAPLLQILSHFDIPEDVYEVVSVGHGLINQSYVVIQTSTKAKLYFLQQIDHHIFKDIPGLMQNIKLVTGHFTMLSHPPNHLTTINTKSKQNYYLSAAGEYWRLYDYVHGKTYHRAETEAIAAEAGKMFGEFLNALSGFKAGLLTTTIPRFHDIDLRYEQFLESLVSGNKPRKEEAAHLIKIVEDNIGYVKEIYQGIVNTCPQRATHNDTKLSNLLFDDQHQGICVIDYDTLMPGYWPLDFGDAVRTICSTTQEDDLNITDTRFDMANFAAFTTRFIDMLAANLTAHELTFLPKSVPYMPFLMGLRMLTDYLNDDVYYTTQYPAHNLDRATNQLTLFMNGVGQLPEMNNIVNENIKKRTF
jgi:Phosphotransferase enzyme family